MAELNDFLNPKSMITPGITVTLTISISMALSSAFSLKFPWVALIVSFMFAVMVVLPRENDHIKGEKPHLERLVYCVLNTLIIFSMSLGTGKSIDSEPRPPAPTPAVLDILKKIEAPTTGRSDFNLFGVSEAYAQEKQNENTNKPAKKNQESKKQAKKLTEAEQQQLQEYVKQLKEYEGKKREHDKKWSFL